MRQLHSNLLTDLTQALLPRFRAEYQQRGGEEDVDCPT
jgi:hypothetical protein